MCGTMQLQSRDGPEKLGGLIFSLELRVHVIDYSSLMFGHNYSDHKRILCFAGFRLG